MSTPKNTPTLNSSETPRKVLIYSRVSTKDQELENQLRQLREYAASQHWVVIETVCDVASGGKNATERHGLGRVLLMAHQRKFDVLLFWSLDRLSREGTRRTIEYLTTLEQHGVDWHSYSEPYLSTLGLFKDAIIAVISCLARMERIRISDRTKAGMQRSAAINGTTYGRPRTSTARIDEARRLRSEGLSFAKIGKHMNISRVRAFQLCKEPKTSDDANC